MAALRFVPFDADDAANLDLYLLTKDIAATVAHLEDPTH